MTMDKERGGPLELPVDEFTYEQEKITRIMPQDAIVDEAYWFRCIRPTHKSPPYADDKAVVILDSDDVDPNPDSRNHIPFAYKDEDSEDGYRIIVAAFSDDGFILGENSHDIDPARPEGLIEVGYLVGSLDPYDIALAELVAKTREAVLV